MIVEMDLLEEFKRSRQGHELGVDGIQLRTSTLNGKLECEVKRQQKRILELEKQLSNLPAIDQPYSENVLEQVFHQQETIQVNIGYFV